MPHSHSGQSESNGFRNLMSLGSVALSFIYFGTYWTYPYSVLRRMFRNNLTSNNGAQPANHRNQQLLNTVRGGMSSAITLRSFYRSAPLRFVPEFSGTLPNGEDVSLVPHRDESDDSNIGDNQLVLRSTRMLAATSAVHTQRYLGVLICLQLALIEEQRNRLSRTSHNELRAFLERIFHNERHTLFSGMVTSFYNNGSGIGYSSGIVNPNLNRDYHSHFGMTYFQPPSVHARRQQPIPLQIENFTNAKKLKELGFPDDCIPEEYCCALGNIIMDTPVTLPGTFNTCEKTYIVRALSAKLENPFNRQPMTIDDVQHNNELQEEINQFVESIKTKIEERLASEPHVQLTTADYEVMRDEAKSASISCRPHV